MVLISLLYLLSIGAVFTLIPIIIIVIFIAAAVGLNKGSSIFALFGFDVLLGMSRHTARKGLTGKRYAASGTPYALKAVAKGVRSARKGREHKLKQRKIWKDMLKNPGKYAAFAKIREELALYNANQRNQLRGKGLSKAQIKRVLSRMSARELDSLLKDTFKHRFSRRALNAVHRRIPLVKRHGTINEFKVPGVKNRDIKDVKELYKHYDKLQERLGAESNLMLLSPGLATWREGVIQRVADKSPSRMQRIKTAITKEKPPTKAEKQILAKADLITGNVKLTKDERKELLSKAAAQPELFTDAAGDVPQGSKFTKGAASSDIKENIKAVKQNLKEFVSNPVPPLKYTAFSRAGVKLVPFNYAKVPVAKRMALNMYDKSPGWLASSTGFDIRFGLLKDPRYWGVVANLYLRKPYPQKTPPSGSTPPTPPSSSKGLLGGTPPTPPVTSKGKTSGTPPPPSSGSSGTGTSGTPPPPSSGGGSSGSSGRSSGKSSGTPPQPKTGPSGPRTPPPATGRGLGTPSGPSTPPREPPSGTVTSKTPASPSTPSSAPKPQAEPRAPRSGVSAGTLMVNENETVEFGTSKEGVLKVDGKEVKPPSMTGSSSVNINSKQGTPLTVSFVEGKLVNIRPSANTPPKASPSQPPPTSETSSGKQGITPPPSVSPQQQPEQESKPDNAPKPSGSQNEYKQPETKQPAPKQVTTPKPPQEPQKTYETDTIINKHLNEAKERADQEEAKRWQEIKKMDTLRERGNAAVSLLESQLHEQQQQRAEAEKQQQEQQRNAKAQAKPLKEYVDDLQTAYDAKLKELAEANDRNDTARILQLAKEASEASETLKAARETLAAKEQLDEVKALKKEMRKKRTTGKKDDEQNDD